MLQAHVDFLLNSREWPQEGKNAGNQGSDFVQHLGGWEIGACFVNQSSSVEKHNRFNFRLLENRSWKVPEAVVEQPASSTALLLDYAGVFDLDSEWDVRLQRGLFSVRSAVIVYSCRFPIRFLFSCGLHCSLWFEFIRLLFGRPSTTARHLCHQSRPWWTRSMKRQAETSQKYKKLIRIQNNYLRTWQMLNRRYVY